MFYNPLHNLFFAFCLVALIAMPAAGADDISDGKKALRRSADYPWYDSDSDSLKQVPLQQSSAPGSTQRNSTWSKSSSDAKSSSSPARGGGMTSGQGGDFSFMKAILWVFVGLLLVSGVALLLWAFLRRESEDTSQIDRLLQANRNDAERIENLPFEVRPRSGNFYDEAKRAYENGNYREAMIYLFSYMLLQMDRQHWIRLSKSKTNRQYLREVGRNRQLAGIFRASLLSFEDVFFGNRDLERSRFEELWRSLTQFEQLMQQTGVEAT